MERPFQAPDDYYSYEKSSDTDQEYAFNTVYDVAYKVIFKPTPNIIEDNKPYSNLLYEFSIVAAFAGPHSYVRDDLIGATVVAIFLDFYNYHNQNICFYICDFSDEKQHVRSRKFNDWYLQYNRGAFVKLDLMFKGYDGATIPASIIMARDNPYKDELGLAAFKLLTDYNNEK